jgi:hypothetical protein
MQVSQALRCPDAGMNEFTMVCAGAHYARIAISCLNQILALVVFRKMADKPEQYQMAYVAEQDRMLLRISTRNKTEFRLWLTRRAVRLLWDGLLQVIEARPAEDTPVEADKREAILQFEHQSAVEQADFETSFEDAADSFPLGEEGVLVSSMHVDRKPDGAYTLKLDPKKGKGITINLDEKLMHSFMQMIIDFSNLAEWGLDLRLSTSESTVSTDLSLPDKVIRH